MLTIVFLLLIANDSKSPLSKMVALDAAVFLIMHFGLTMLMALKRVRASLVHTL